MNRAEALAKIRNSIKDYGYHVYIISSYLTPRYVYTIGLSDALGGELVLAGCAFYDGEEVGVIVDSVRKQLASSGDFRKPYVVDGLGVFSLKRVDDTWGRLLLLGALDYFGADSVRAYQIVPDGKNWTIDTPDLSKHRSASGEPVWRWLVDEWPYEVPEDSTAWTGLDVLRGVQITQAARWEEDNWEMFSDEPPSAEEARLVPLATLLAADRSLEPAVKLRPGEGMWRVDGDWEVNG